MTRILAEIPLWALVYPPTAIWAAWLWLRARKSGQSPFDAFPAQFPLALAAAIYLSTFRWHGGDDIPNSLLPFSLLRHGTLSMEPFRAWFMEKGIAPEFTVHPGGILISIFPVMPALLALPFFLPAVLFTAQPPELLMHGLSKVSASFLAAASVAVFHLLARERASPRWAAAAALFFAFGTYSFSVSSQALFQHAPAQLGLALGLWGLLCSHPGRKEDWISGFGFSLAFASRPDSVFFLAAAGLYLLFRERRRVPFFSLGAAVPAAFLAYYWLVYTGRLRPQDSDLQGRIFSSFQPEAVAALLIGPTRGLLLFVPAAVFGLWGMLKRARDPRALWAPWLALTLPAIVAFYSFYSNWTGGQTFGTRYYATSCLILALFILEQSREISASPLLCRLWGLTFAWSVLVHAVGAYFTWPGSFSIVEQKAQVWDLSLYPPFYLGSSSGPLFTLPLPLRWAVAAAAFAAVYFAAKRLSRWLAAPSA
ncbi:MAG TPA: hypothetical protein DCM05_02835 [Elusimicrobia bacterium]|nr:hypothetical protein [Elusimicrobiota bacterium]